MKRLMLSVSAAALLASPVWAESNFLIVGNSEPGVLQRLTGEGDVENAQAAFESRSVQVSLANNADADEMRTVFREFASGLEASTEDVGLFLSGRFVSTVAGTYLLPAETDGDLTLAQVVTEGFPVDAAYAIAAEYPGRALIVLGQAGLDDADLSDGLSASLPLDDIPQGVTVANGPARDAARFVSRLSGETGADILPWARAAGLRLEGFVPRELPLFAGEDVTLPQVTDDAAPEDDTQTDEAAARERAAWGQAVAADSESGYETYLAAFPEGSNAEEAQSRLETIRSEPFYREKQAEAALDLSVDERREIQRDLSLLDYNTRGIDGIFGPGTRGAVTAWQSENGLAASGYLTSDQIARLDAQAERRAAELEEEARERRAELERQDRYFWAETGAQGDEAGFRAYLNRFPDGIYADRAQVQLDAIEQQRRAQAEQQDARRWQAARDADTEAAYRAYLAERPDGAFAEEARARIDYFNQNSEQIAAQERAQADEAALGLNAAARQLAEARLADLGLEPGPVDGSFDEATRSALRRYQDARNLRVSGYLDQATVVRLMADTILR